MSPSLGICPWWRWQEDADWCDRTLHIIPLLRFIRRELHSQGIDHIPRYRQCQTSKVIRRGPPTTVPDIVRWDEQKNIFWEAVQGLVTYEGWAWIRVRWGACAVGNVNAAVAARNGDSCGPSCMSRWSPRNPVWILAEQLWNSALRRLWWQLEC